MIRKRLGFLVLCAGSAYALAFTASGTPPKRMRDASASRSRSDTQRVEARPLREPRLVAAGSLPTRPMRTRSFESAPVSPEPASTPPDIPSEAYTQAYESALAREHRDAEWNRQVHAALVSA